jgi:23S rRNA (cytidine1920-2'-O)/16S rRNA (cytidine1409-2'-O)-methyltransferase
LVRRGLVSSRRDALQVIESGGVLVGGAPAEKAARLVSPDEPVVLVGPPAPYVSRGGVKLEAGLVRFGVVTADRRALDVGASTGGFTDCLLQRGASHVYAVDVGHGQLHPSLRHDPRVTVLEHTNARDLDANDLRSVDPAFTACPLVVGDLSFISLRRVAPALAGSVAATAADLVVLVKPQFEVGRVAVSRGRGVVRDPGQWLDALEGVASALVNAGTGIMGAMASPLTGAAGNSEFLLHARKGEQGLGGSTLDATLSAAVAEAVDRHRVVPAG